MTNINIILYSTECPKCKILKQKLDEANITYIVCSDIEIIKNKGFRSVPMVEINNKIMNYLECINWIKEHNS